MEKNYKMQLSVKNGNRCRILLSITNLLLHDIEAPNIANCDSLGTNITDFKESDKVDVIGMNPPYGGSTEDSIKSNFPVQYRSSETADLFIALIMYRLKVGGRCGVIIPDGFLFGTDGAKLALKENLLRKFNLHTIIRLPGSIFSPYTSIATNILFFNNEAAEGCKEGFKTKETWFYRFGYAGRLQALLKDQTNESGTHAAYSRMVERQKRNHQVTK